MNTVNYTKAFKEAVALEVFLGMGNPNGQILIVGKEAAIDSEKHPDQYKREIKNNTVDWDNNIKQQTSFSEVNNWFETRIYNPLYPYKGQLNKVASHDKEGNVIKGKGGTSKTWYNYQKLHDALYHNSVANSHINFHEKVFISELNDITAKSSDKIPKAVRKESITKRKALFKKSFFRQFPITIVAVGHYVRDFNINLEELFEVQYNSEKSKLHTENLKNEFINIHFDSLDHPTRLLIHTNQLSMVSNELVIRLGAICKTFLNQK